MICPRCETSLLRKERPHNTCSTCHQRYALDPKTNLLRLHDLRIRRVLGKLTDEGRLPCAPGQLWYALSRRSLRDQGIEWGCFGVPLFAGIVVICIGLAAATFMLVLGSVLLAVAVSYLVAAALGFGRGKPDMPRADFWKMVLDPWRDVYGELPRGVVDDRSHPTPGPFPAGEPRTTLLCSDPSIAAFLGAADLRLRYGVHLAREVGDVLPSGPVIVLHDASAHGLVAPPRTRAALPGRHVIDAGLPLRTVRALPNAVPLRESKPDRATMDELTASGQYTPDELKWLRKGWTFPLVAVPPARLLSVVERIAEQAGRPAAPPRQQAATIGFLTWPTAAGP
ncbi:hypothetical protein AAHZ94_06485 [Streptomyces sp. HSW2009]|uniref:hypothetical protein n=1 Tax=Streptomyces sp. HSW2009 TaxID=3142890 RepID=UPI0032EFB873